MVGRTFGNYRAVAELGEGGMGIVYLAEHVLIGKQAAIKVLHPELLRSPEAAARFFHEAKAVAAIRHEHIVDVTDFGQSADGDIYTIMELLEGESLGQRLRRDSVLAPPLAVDIVGQAASALGAAHACGVVHRDLKPDNLFLTRRAGRDPFVKVLDFGIAKVLGKDAGGVKTRTGVLIGTPQYMAPEQCSEKNEVDGRADIYALGMILYQMLTGRVAFDAGGFTDTLLLQLTEPVTPPRTLNPYVPEGIEAVVLRCLEKDREHRFATMEEMLRALEPFLRRVATLASAEPPPKAPSPRVADAPLATTARDSPLRSPRPTQPTTLSGRAVELRTGVGRRGVWLGAIGLVAVASLALVIATRPEPTPSPPRLAVPIPAIRTSDPAPSTTRAPDAAPVVATPPPPRTSAVGFVSTPPADVTRRDSGEKLGTTPFQLQMPVAAAAFDVEFRRRGYHPVRVRVEPERGGPVSAVLRRRVALAREDDLKGLTR